MSEAPEMAAGVIVQSVVIDDDGDASGYRILDDGRYEVLAPDGSWDTESSLSREQVDDIRRAIADTKVTEVAPRHEPDTPMTHASTVWIQVDDHGRRHSIAIVGGCDVPSVNAFTARLLDVFRPEH